MAQKVATRDGSTEVPTATEFIPRDELAAPNRDNAAMVRHLQRVRDGKGVEIAAHEPYDDVVPHHCYVCDECGHSENTEKAIAFHLRTQHE